VLEAGTYALCANKGKKERIGRLLMMHANNREDVKIARTGDIIAVAGLKDVITGETLCDEKAPVILERMEFPGARVSSLPLDRVVHYTSRAFRFPGAMHMHSCLRPQSPLPACKLPASQVFRELMGASFPMPTACMQLCSDTLVVWLYGTAVSGRLAPP
jgi:hypothetical protein